MYEGLVKELRDMAQARGLILPRAAADAIEALERNAGCPAWDSCNRICCIMNMPVKDEQMDEVSE